MSRKQRNEQMNDIINNICSLENLKNALEIEIENRSTFTNEGRNTFLEHYCVQSLRSIEKLEKEIKSFRQLMLFKLKK